MSEYTDMMENAAYCEEEQGHPKDAADWRAIQEAWEELIAASQAFAEVGKKNLYPTPDKPNSDWDKLKRLEAALTKARAQRASVLLATTLNWRTKRSNPSESPALNDSYQPPKPPCVRVQSCCGR